MERASKLCELLSGWLDRREQCAGKLLEVAQELESVDQRSISQVDRAGTSAAALATVFTQGLTSPLLFASAFDTVPSRLVEAGVSERTFNTAVGLIKEDEKVGRSIQQLLQDLRWGCGGGQLGACINDVECEVASLLMWALAMRNNTVLPLNFLRSFNRATFFRQASSGGLVLSEASRFICSALGFVRLDAREKQQFCESCLKVSAKEMVEDIGSIGTRAAAEVGSRAVGGTSLGMPLYDLITACEEMIQGNQVTEAGRFLRHSAREVLEGRRKLKEQLDAMTHELSS